MQTGLVSRKGTKTVHAAASLLVIGFCSQAFGQFNLLDQTRSLTANATGTASGTGQFDSGPVAGTQSLNSNSDLLTGAYSNNLAGSKTDSPNDGAGDISAFNVSSSAGQTSIVSSSLLSGTGAVGASAVLSPIEGGTDFSADGIGQSSYNVDFTVSSPTPFNLTGDVTGNAIYHLGRLESIAANITLSNASGPLYSVSFAPTGYSVTGESFNEPASFSTVLEPGQTYTLDAAASVDSGRDGIGLTSVAPASAGFTFTASVPEPSTLIIILPFGILLRRSRSGQGSLT
jgi:hypothetical protein